MTVRRFISLLLVYVLMCIAGGTAASGFFAPVVIGINNAAKGLIPSLKSETITMDLTDLPQQSRMYASDGKTVIAQFYDQNRIVVALKDISEPMQKAVVAREDRRFLEHSGIDPQGIARAFIQTYVKGGDTQGGSTLTQQYVKNVLIDQAEEDDDPIAAYHASEETIARKLREMLISVELEKHHSKSEILQGYLNIAQFGTNVYGVETAAQHYFSKSAKDLNLGEAATIAAITKNPASYDPTVHPDTSEKQRNVVLDLMQETGFATAAAVKAAKKVPLKSMLKIKSVAVGCQTAGTAAFFCDYVVHKILNSKSFGKTEAIRKKLLYQGGLKIYTTMNVSAQAAAWDAVTTEVPVKDISGVENVLAAIKPGTGEVLALAQNRYYDATTSADQYSTSINYAVDQVDGGGLGFQMGSTWKPINFAAWLKAGKSANQPLRTYTSYNQGSFPCYHSSNVPWNVTNSEGGTVNPETPLHALNYSHNTTQASMAQIIGLCAIADTATEMGYHNSSEAQSDVHSTMTPTMVIGGGANQASPLTMANVYATIAAGGKECTPIAMTKVIDSDGKNLTVPSAGCHQAISKDVAETTAYAMNLNVTQGIAKAAQLSDGRKTFAKTGTSEKTTLATGGFIPQVSAVDFVGNAENLAILSNLTINGVRKSQWYGADIALPSWKLFMEQYVKKAKIKADNSYGTPNQTMLTTGTGAAKSSSSSSASGTTTKRTN